MFDCILEGDCASEDIDDKSVDVDVDDARLEVDSCLKTGDVFLEIDVASVDDNCSFTDVIFFADDICGVGEVDCILEGDCASEDIDDNPAEIDVDDAGLEVDASLEVGDSCLKASDVFLEIDVVSVDDACSFTDVIFFAGGSSDVWVFDCILEGNCASADIDENSLDVDVDVAGLEVVSCLKAGDEFLEIDFASVDDDCSFTDVIFFADGSCGVGEVDCILWGDCASEDIDDKSADIDVDDCCFRGNFCC